MRAPLFMGGLSLLRANARARAPINVFNVIYKRLGPLSSTRTNRASIHRAHARAPLSRHTRARALAHHAREFFTLFLYSRLSSSRLESTLLLSCRLAFSLVSSLAFCLSHLISLISIAISPLVFRLRRSSLILPCLPSPLFSHTPECTSSSCEPFPRLPFSGHKRWRVCAGVTHPAGRPKSVCEKSAQQLACQRARPREERALTHPGQPPHRSEHGPENISQTQGTRSTSVGRGG